MRNLEALAEISAEVLVALRLHAKPSFLCAQVSSVIGISGAAALGKTVLASELSVFLNNQGIDTAVIGLDGYLWKRSVRKARQLSGYEPGATDLQKLSADLRRLLVEGLPVDIPI